MKVEATSLPGLLSLQLAVFGDHRGRFMETYRRQRYLEAGIDAEFVQDNFVTSARGTLRGLHYQLKQPQGKLIHVTRGEVFDVAVDIRRGSPTFGNWYGCTLSAENHRQLWIPAGFAHAFLVTSESADFVYKTTAYYSPDDERAIRWNDPDIGIQWPWSGDPTLSARDNVAPWLRDADVPSFTP